MQWHLFFDFLAYGVGAWLSFFIFSSPYPRGGFYYYLFLIFGFIAGALFFGSLNTYLSLGSFYLSKSVIGALFGGIVAVELTKRYYGIKGSTGAYFVPSLVLGIAIGRIGCFLGGLDDFTYGVETDLPWGVDFGDGVMRHPVQLYESVLMFIFFIITLVIYRKNRKLFENKIFYIFVIYYGLERFVLEFLKPYEGIVYNINLFQILCIILIVYGIYHLRKRR